MYNNESEYDSFENHLQDEDYGLVIDRYGNLKGLFIPEGLEQEPVPQAIVNLCKDHFGIDPLENSDSPRLH